MFIGINSTNECPGKTWECQTCISQLLLPPHLQHFSRFTLPSLLTFSVRWKVEKSSNVVSWKVRWGSKQTNTCHSGRKSVSTQHILLPHKSMTSFYTGKHPAAPSPPFTHSFTPSPLLIFCLLWSPTYRSRPHQKSQPAENFERRVRKEAGSGVRWRKAKSILSYCWNNPITMPIKLSFTGYSF